MAKEVNEEKQGIEAKIEVALRSRIQHFKENADSFTLEKVRRLIEEDLELEKYALDVHKRFIKQFLEKQMENADDDGVPKDSQENLEKDTSSTKQEKEVLESLQKQVLKKDIKEPALDAEMDDSPIMGVMSSKLESVDAQDVKTSESSIKKAIWERAAHFRTNSEYASSIAVCFTILSFTAMTLYLPVLPTIAWGLIKPTHEEKEDFCCHCSCLKLLLFVCSLPPSCLIFLKCKIFSREVFAHPLVSIYIRSHLGSNVEQYCCYTDFAIALVMLVHRLSSSYFIPIYLHLFPGMTCHDFDLGQS